MSGKSHIVSKQRRESFIQQMNRKWQKKYKEQQEWLDSMERGSLGQR